MSAQDSWPYCPRCTKSYPPGDKTGHCGKCHETFFGQSAFEAHRRGAHGPERHCINPAEDTKNEWRQDDKGRWKVGPELTEQAKAKIWGDSK